jgi:hypothetical protein
LNDSRRGGFIWPRALRIMSSSACMEETERVMVGVDGESNETMVEKHLSIK